MTNKKYNIEEYLEINNKMQRMLGLIDSFQIRYIQSSIKEHIIEPLIKDGFEEDDINLLMSTAIHAAVNNLPKIESQELYED